MRGNRQRAVNCIGLALGLLSIALHFSVLAWHPIASSSIQRADKQLLADLQVVVCHGAAVVSPRDASSGDDVPSPPDRKTECLFCKLVTDSWLAIPARAELALLGCPSSRLANPVSADATAARFVLAPRNRGPPGPA
jgi:Protein of unknown function (DUF2946)